MDRRSAPEAERLLGGGLSDDDENLLDGERPDTQEDSRARPKQDNNYSNRKLRNRVQFEVEQVQGIMRDNVEKMLDRGERVVELADKSDSLNNQADSFLQASKRMQKRLWWRQYKLRLLIGITLITVLLIIVVKMLWS
ncbi:synaptobrevin homolog 2-like isoform X1 [Varroa destructor]|uniref:V-SNARE coiled-coil homology domain-containing protein n=1 Tax=Varroa destructor TaxID=109461 RepID=A0A7M7K736_VARDE|nr:synaptobrevin homolog 2-like isoform X1 [Varroa destructor]XP_022662641.1 synaptobrevin homolog 2-like isoform X1 [Varroa destructor]